MVNADPAFMTAALRAVHETRGTTWPNPTVGCVLVDPKTNDIVATGVTQPGGHPHAEMDALLKAGKRARGAHAYITLEPCNHTSPSKPCSCTHAMIDAGVTAVFAAMPDPDPRMSGKSFELLRAAGIEVQIGLRHDDAWHSLRGHVTRVLDARPFLTVKLAVSPDGKLGLPGQRVDISAPESWQRTYIQRGKVDAVMIGIGTALADDPMLTNRNPGVTHQPVRIVIDTHGRLPLDSKLVRTAGDAPVWVISAQPNAALEQAGVRVIPSAMDIRSILQTLHDQGLGHILCEGGKKLACSLLENDLVDECLMIHGVKDVGAAGIPCPVLGGNMRLRTTDKIGPDTWKIYDSAHALDVMRGFFARFAPADGPASRPSFSDTRRSAR